MSAKTKNEKFVGKTKKVAYNPYTRRWETVWPEDEIPQNANLITMYWVESHQRYVTIPE